MMKSINEIIEMLASELSSNLSGLRSSDNSNTYFNKYLGDTSFLMAALLDSILHDKYSEWDDENWIDDSLISNFAIYDSILILEGVMIFGNSYTTKQWIDPFQFRASIIEGRVDLKNFKFKFGDVDLENPTYEMYRGFHDPKKIVKVKIWKFIIEHCHVS